MQLLYIFAFANFTFTIIGQQPIGKELIMKAQIIVLAAAAGLLIGLNTYEERKQQKEISEYFKRRQEQIDSINENLRKVGIRQ